MTYAETLVNNYHDHDGIIVMDRKEKVRAMNFKRFTKINKLNKAKTDIFFLQYIQLNMGRTEALNSAING